MVQKLVHPSVSSHRFRVQPTVQVFVCGATALGEPGGNDNVLN